MPKASDNAKKKETHGINNPKSYPLQQRLFDLDASAHYLGRSVYSLRTLIWNGELAVVRNNKKMWLDIRDLDAWIERSKERLTA